MSPLLIIGYGNPLRGDDGVGPEAAGRLGGLAVHQLTPELMEPIARAQRVVFIDAAVGPNPGEITEREIRADTTVLPFTHHATPESLLAGALQLYGAAPPATLITVTAASFELGEQLSEPVRSALPKVLSRPCLRCR